MRDKIVTAVFCLMLGGLFLVNLLTPDTALSYSERRELLQAPKIDGTLLLSGEAQTEIESWLLDQFAFRDGFRGIKAAADLKLFRKKDNNGVYVVGERVYKMDFPMKEQSVRGLAAKMNEIYDLYLRGCHVAFALIPDKSAYSAREEGYLTCDYYEMWGLLSSELDPRRFSAIDLIDALDTEDFYRTDLHWKQEGLGGPLKRIGDCFGTALPAAGLGRDVEGWSDAGYDVRSYTPFYGAYYGQAALNLHPDTLSYFVSPVIEGLVVRNMDDRAIEGDEVIYNEKKLGGMDSYEIFLSGNSPLIILDNPQASNDRELIVFRDSFGSSIAPFLAEGYARVTLIDLRFVGYANIGQFVSFDSGDDVLFLLSAGVANSSDMIRKY